MYPVTKEWRTISNRTLRNPSYVKIVFAITDPDASKVSELSDNQHLSYSAVENVDLGATAPSTYQTLEQNRFILDGSSPLAVEENPIYQGYVSNSISDDDCTFSDVPQIDISFGKLVTFAGLTFDFDADKGDYPTLMEVVFFKGLETVGTIRIEPDSSQYEYNKATPLFDRMIIRFLKTNVPRRRARLTAITYGLINTLGVDDILSCVSTKEIDLLSSKLPMQDFEFTILDTQRKYDPENPDGVWEYLESRQPVSYFFGVEMDNKRIKWIPWGLSFSTGDFEVTNQGKASNVTIKCAGLANHLNMIYGNGVYSPQGKSLFDLANEVMSFAGFQNIQLDDKLKEITTHAPMPVQSVGECLQLIANAGRCIMGHGRGGNITIFRENSQNTGFDMTFDKILDTPTTTKIPPLRTLSTSYNTISVDNEITEAVTNAEVNNAVYQTLTFSHEGYVNQKMFYSGHIKFDKQPTFYAYQTVVTVTGTGTITIKGNKLINNNVSYSKQYSEVGEDMKDIQNPLIDNRADAIAYADWIASVVSRRNSYTAPDRGYPELDAGDTIKFTSNFRNEIPVTVVMEKTSYNGGISGEGKYIIGGGR